MIDKKTFTKVGRYNAIDIKNLPKWDNDAIDIKTHPKVGRYNAINEHS